MVNPPYVIRADAGCSKQDCYLGSFADVVTLLANIMNFTFTIVNPEDKQFGTKLQNGTFTGMIGELPMLLCGLTSWLSLKQILFLYLQGMTQRHEIDVAGSDFTVTSIRNEVIDYLMPFAESHLRLFISNSAGANNWGAFIKPLTQEVFLIRWNTEAML